MPARKVPLAACGLDFGTSNSALSLPDGDSVRLVPLEGDATSIPTAIFFGTEDPFEVSYGRAAVCDYLDGAPGRLMRSPFAAKGGLRAPPRTHTIGHEQSY